MKLFAQSCCRWTSYACSYGMLV